MSVVLLAPVTSCKGPSPVWISLSRCTTLQVAATKARRLKYAGVGQRLVQEPLFVTLQADGSDLWRLDPVIDILRNGGVSLFALYIPCLGEKTKHVSTCQRTCRAECIVSF